MNVYLRNLIIVVCVVIVIGAIWTLGKKTAGHAEAVASGHPEWPPIMYQNGDIIDGVGPVMVKKIFTDLGLEVSFPYSGAWDQVQAKARTGDVDVLVAAYKTSAREEYMEYSEPYTTDPIVLFVAKGKTFPFEKWDDLKGKKGVATVGDSYGQEFDNYSASNLDLARATTTADAFGMVAHGTADYFIYSLYAGNVELKKEGAAAGFEALPKNVTEENFYITISKKSSFVKYMPQINALIEKYRADGTIDRILKEYKGK
jgi:polar amino acid transport system substrate-binding protein